MNAITVPAVVVEPVAVLTECGAQFAALSRCRDILPATTASVIRAELDRRITSVLATA